jgi:hypothetical protein
MTEIRNARQAEIRESRRKLFPIRLVGFDAIRKWKCFDADTGKDLAVELREYHIPDFSNWKDHDLFEVYRPETWWTGVRTHREHLLMIHCSRAEVNPSDPLMQKVHIHLSLFARYSHSYSQPFEACPNKIISTLI